MILKLVKNAKYDVVDSTEIVEQLETEYLEIKSVERIVPGTHRFYNDELGNKIYKNETLMIDCKDGTNQIRSIGTFTSENHIEYLYKNIYLMNDEGKTIERII